MLPQFATSPIEAENATLLDENVSKENGEPVGRRRIDALRYLNVFPTSKYGRAHFVLLHVVLLFMGLYILWDFRTHGLSLKNDPSQGFFCT